MLFRDTADEDTYEGAIDGINEIEGGVDSEAIAFIKAKKRFENLQRAKRQEKKGVI